MTLSDYGFGEDNPRGARWCLTWNNYPEDWEQLLRDVFNKIDVQYFIVGKEVAPTTGTPHLQGYFRTSSCKCLRGLTNYNIPWHLERARGTEQENINYCSKEEDYIEEGQPYSDKRTKVSYRSRKEQNNKEETKLRMKKFLDDIVTLNRIELEARYPRECFYHNEKILNWKVQHVEFNSIWDGKLEDKNYWVWGPTGTGKSLWARKQGDVAEIYPKPINKWWNGFVPIQHKVVILDDYPGDGDFLLQYLKIWADRYSFIGETKGSQITIYPGSYVLIVTANHSIDDSFSKSSEEDVNALKRRFTEVNIKDKEDIFLSLSIDRKLIL